MNMTLMQWAELLLFMALMLAVSMFWLSVSGQFPLSHRTPPFRSVFGGIVLFGSILLSLVALAAGFYCVYANVPWYALVIGGGGMVLITPLLLPGFSDRFVDGRGSLLTFSSLAAVASVVLAWLA